MWEDLSVNAENLLGRLVVLGEERLGGEVKDVDLLKEVELDYDAYVDAAKELIDAGLAVSDDSDLYFLKATPEGTDRIRSL